MYRRLHLGSLVAAAALASVLPPGALPRFQEKEAEPEPSAEELSRQRKRYLQRQARKAKRQNRKGRRS